MSAVPPPFVLGTDYISLPVEAASLAHLPGTVDAAGTTLLKKTEFHISLVRVPEVARSLRKPEAWVVSRFAEHAAKGAIDGSFRFTGELRLAEAGERKSVVALCAVPGLPEFFDALSEEAGEGVLPQPTHLTLYTRQENMGIHLSTQDAMAACAPVELPEVASALR